jgi:hypothetical protein
LRSFKDDKSFAENKLKGAQECVDDFSDAKEDRRTIKMNANELNREKSKAMPVMIERLLHKLISGIALYPGKAKISYWTTQKKQFQCPGSFVSRKV